MAYLPGKGLKAQLCNREACQKPGAFWYNTSTRCWYCADCAHLINASCRQFGEPFMCFNYKPEIDLRKNEAIDLFMTEDVIIDYKYKIHTSDVREYKNIIYIPTLGRVQSYKQAAIYDGAKCLITGETNIQNGFSLVLSDIHIDNGTNISAWFRQRSYTIHQSEDSSWNKKISITLSVSKAHEEVLNRLKLGLRNNDHLLSYELILWAIFPEHFVFYKPTGLRQEEAGNRSLAFAGNIINEVDYRLRAAKEKLEAFSHLRTSVNPIEYAKVENDVAELESLRGSINHISR